jgi:hypothetical protein
MAVLFSEIYLRNQRMYRPRQDTSWIPFARILDAPSRLQVLSLPAQRTHKAGSRRWETGSAAIPETCGRRRQHGFRHGLGRGHIVYFHGRLSARSSRRRRRGAVERPCVAGRPRRDSEYGQQRTERPSEERRQPYAGTRALCALTPPPRTGFEAEDGSPLHPSR